MGTGGHPRGRQLIVAAGLCLVAACSGGEAAEAPTPTPVPAATRTPAAPVTPTPTPTPTPDPEEARLEELRASDAFVEYAEHERAQTGQWSRFAYDEFTLSTDDQGVRAEWTNKDELWDELMPPFRDECLLAGPPATRPIWDGQIMIPVGLSPRWSDSSTGGRGQFVNAFCTYLDATNDEVVERWIGVLIQTEQDGRGRTMHVSPPIEFREGEVHSYQDRDQQLRSRLWTWISEVPA